MSRWYVRRHVVHHLIVNNVIQSVHILINRFSSVVKNITRAALLLFLCCATAQVSAADKGPVDAGIKLISVSAESTDLPHLIEFIDELLFFAKPVTVLTEVEEGPLFDPEHMEIWMPGTFADIIAEYFGDEDAPIADVYFHTLFHEIGHVLFAQYDLPLLAREEDAADALANVLLLEFVEGGAEVVLNAAEMFGLESEDRQFFDETDFWSEHSLDIQRYYTSICHVYGSDPDSHEELINTEYGLSEERAEDCEYEYERIRRGWLAVLKPYLKY